MDDGAGAGICAHLCGGLPLVVAGVLALKSGLRARVMTREHLSWRGVGRCGCMASSMLHVLVGRRGEEGSVARPMTLSL
eukprot:scaffold263323_cov32-Tisochrysis_lutea.AAC.1